jgi:transcriptional regulator with XRE-family HTH domain
MSGKRLLSRHDTVVGNFRDSLGLTQEKLAEVLGITLQDVSRYETGRSVMVVGKAKRFQRVAGEMGFPFTLDDIYRDVAER